MLSWFKKLCNGFMSCFNNSPSPAAEPVIEERVSLHDDLDIISARLLHAAVVNNHRAFDIERLEVLCNNIDSYIQLLQDTESALEGTGEFPSKELSLRLVKVCNFYRNDQGQFVNILDKRKLMISHMLRMLKAYRAAQATANPPGWLSHAILRSMTVVVNIDSLSTQLAKPRLGAE